MREWGERLPPSGPHPEQDTGIKVSLLTYTFNSLSKAGLGNFSVTSEDGAP